MALTASLPDILALSVVYTTGSFVGAGVAVGSGVAVGAGT